MYVIPQGHITWAQIIEISEFEIFFFFNAVQGFQMNVVETKVETQGKTPVLLSERLNCVVQVSVDGGQFRTYRLSKDESGNLGFSHGSASV